MLENNRLGDKDIVLYEGRSWMVLNFLEALCNDCNHRSDWKGV